MHLARGLAAEGLGVLVARVPGEQIVHRVHRLGGPAQRQEELTLEVEPVQAVRVVTNDVLDKPECLIIPPLLGEDGRLADQGDGVRGPNREPGVVGLERIPRPFLADEENSQGLVRIG